MKMMMKVKEKALRLNGIKGKYKKNLCDNHTGNTHTLNIRLHITNY